MAFGNLSAQIKFGSTIYALQLEEVVVSIRRNPYNLPMLGGIPPEQYDMGMSDPSIRIRGILPVASGSDGTNTIASKDVLEDAITDDYDEDIDFILESGAGAVGSTTTYRVKISDFSATLIATKEEIYWAFTMSLLALFRDG
tara:strand:+ start:1205 stop:1630 length:426 start_codon:yes stop_codon:yes gene_type:complete